MHGDVLLPLREKMTRSAGCGEFQRHISTLRNIRIRLSIAHLPAAIKNKAGT